MWTVGLDGVNASVPPTIVGDTAFFCTGFSTSNKLFAYNLTTGKLLWSAFPYTGPPSNLATSNNPFYHNGRLIIAAANALMSVNSSTGAIVWSKSQVFSTNISSPVADNNKIFVSSENKLLAFNETNGDLLWSFPIGGMSKRPLCTNNLLVFGTLGKIYALNQSTGAIVWERDFSTALRTYPTEYSSPYDR